MNKIRITQCTGNRWYAHLVGQVVPYERFEKNQHEWQGIPCDVYWVREGGHFNPINYVLACDAEEVKEEQSATVKGILAACEESRQRMNNMTPLEKAHYENVARAIIAEGASKEIASLQAQVSALQAKEAMRLNELKELQAAQRRCNAERDRWKSCARRLGEVLYTAHRTEADTQAALRELQRMEDAK